MGGGGKKGGQLYGLLVLLLLKKKRGKTASGPYIFFLSPFFSLFKSVSHSLYTPQENNPHTLLSITVYLCGKRTNEQEHLTPRFFSPFLFFGLLRHFIAPFTPAALSRVHLTIRCTLGVTSLPDHCWMGARKAELLVGPVPGSFLNVRFEPKLREGAGRFKGSRALAATP